MRKLLRMTLKTLLSFIDQRLKVKSLTDRKASMAAGIGPDGIRTMRNGFVPKLEKLQKLAPVLGVQVDDLLNALNPGAEKRDASSPPTETSKPIPEIDVRGGAGLGGEAPLENLTARNGATTSTDAVKGEWSLPADYLSEIRVNPATVRIIEVAGDSMTRPDGGGLHSGDRVMVDVSDKNPSPPGIFAVWDGFGVIVKRLERIPRTDPPIIRLISDNPAHAPYELTADEISIIGRLKWFARRL